MITSPFFGLQYGPIRPESSNGIGVFMNLEQLKIHREALQTARLSGVLTVRTGEKYVTYKSDKEMQSTLADLERQIANLEGRSTPRRIRTFCAKGL
jgi:hypothetical protein